MSVDVENLTNRHIKCGDWVFLPKKIHRGVPEYSFPAEALVQARGPNPTLLITPSVEYDGEELFVIPIVEPNGS